MYKYKNSNQDNWTCCPMGSHRGNGVVDCYWYGLVTLKDCGNCTTRKDKQKIKK